MESISTIVATALGIVGKYAFDKGLQAAKETTKEGVLIAKEILQTIKTHFQEKGDTEGQSTMQLYENNPATFQTALQTILEQHAAEYQTLAQQLATLNEKFEAASPEAASEVKTSVSIKIGGSVRDSKIITAGGDVNFTDK